MYSPGELLTFAFYGVMVLALLYFLHKVAWFIQFRRLQSRLVERALARMGKTTDATLLRWDMRADDSWHEAGTVDRSPEAYIARIESEIREASTKSSLSLTKLKEAIVDEVLDRPHEKMELVALELHRLREPPMRIAIVDEIPAIRMPEPPDESLFELEFRSRYSLKERLLTFILGAADVFYSSNHVAKMSQNAGLPLSVVLRRTSLIVLILVAILVDIAFGIQKALIAKVEGFVGEREGFYYETLPTLIGGGLWLSIYGLIYLSLFFYLWSRSLVHRRRLRAMQSGFNETLSLLMNEHRERLGRWARDYGAMLDEASSVVLKQAEMLYERAIDRIRRRLASHELLEHADRASRAFFVRLPESSQKLEDVATGRRHSLRHLIWPRAEEMEYQVRHAQYRAAFRHLDLIGSELRGPSPDSKKAQELWRALVAYARMFPEVLPDDFRQTLKEAYDRNLERLIENTESDLRELDVQLTELAEGLKRTFIAAGPLIESRVELESESAHGELARYTSKIVRVREQARLEAMAFEI